MKEDKRSLLNIRRQSSRNLQIFHSSLLLDPAEYSPFHPQHSNFKTPLTNAIITYYYLCPVPAFFRLVLFFPCLLFLLFRCCPHTIGRNGEWVLDVLHAAAWARCRREVLAVRCLDPLNPGAWRRLHCWALDVVRTWRWCGELLQRL